MTGDPVFNVKVASIQMEPRIGQKKENLARSLQMIEVAAAEGASLIVLPELANTGYNFSDRAEALALAEAVPDGESAQAWTAIAERLNIHLVAGITEQDGSRIFNSALVIGPQGLLGTYRKLHLWARERLVFEAGDLGLPVFDTPVGRIGVAICYDGWFPEVYRLLAMQGADFVCVPTNWVPMAGEIRTGPSMANTLTMAGAHSNGLSIICANRIGTERGQEFTGQSVIVASNGFPVAGPASRAEEEILYAVINLEQSRSGRDLNAFNHVLRDRRHDVYDPMLGTGWPPSPA
ncbi:nitrilase family protein [Undibacterium sp.]|uniref:nitrilase family protein n=1 Tax=Undibacterium sp. TaxID=1914977 RepID=UPI00374DB15C